MLLALSIETDAANGDSKTLRSVSHTHSARGQRRGRSSVVKWHHLAHVNTRVRAGGMFYDVSPTVWDHSNLRHPHTFHVRPARLNYGNETIDLCAATLRFIDIDACVSQRTVSRRSRQTNIHTHTREYNTRSGARVCVWVRCADLMLRDVVNIQIRMPR